MKIKNFFKFFISLLAIVLLAITFNVKNSIEDNSKLVIQSNTNVSNDTLKASTNNDGFKKTIKTDNSGLQLLPVPNTRSPIVLTPLSYNQTNAQL